MVLAAVETRQGVYGGTNVENVNYTLTKHAEELAILAALLGGAGPRGAWIKTLYVTSAPPCGSCRQFIAEFGGPNTIVLVEAMSQTRVRRASLPALREEGVEAWPLRELLPRQFAPKDLRRRLA